MNRKQRRAMKKELGEEQSKKLSQKIFQFDKLPDECLACLKTFDKKSKEMAKTWNVVVRDEDETVKLYCPDCWTTAQKIIKEFKERKNEDHKIIE